MPRSDVLVAGVYVGAPRGGLEIYSVNSTMDCLPIGGIALLISSFMEVYSVSFQYMRYFAPKLLVLT